MGYRGYYTTMTVVAPGDGDSVGLVTIKNPGEPPGSSALYSAEATRRPIARSRVHTIYIWDRKFRCMEGEGAGTDGASLPAKENNKNE